jgi:hypothetical protein
MFESGVLVAADWVRRRGPYLRSLSVLMQSGVRDAWIEPGDGATAIESSVSVSNAGEPAGQPIARACAVCTT